MNHVTIKIVKNEIDSAKSVKELEKVRIKYLGRKGVANKLLAKIKNIAPSKRKTYGRKINRLKQSIQKLLQEKKINFQKKQKSKKEIVSKKFALKKIGHLHPISITEREINNLLKSLGFSIYTGPEIETDEYCFERLNLPKDHPARDLQDSIYIKAPEVLLRTQTSSIETRLLANEKPPFKAAFPGRVYRNEKVNASNHFIFHQYQAVVVDKKITMKDLIGTLDALYKHLFGKEAELRYRCKYYPEVEPGLGIDLKCFACQGKGCKLCKNVGWIEVGGAGIIHPNVLRVAGINPKIWRGFAFGLGLDRTVMANYHIKDVRTLLGGNLAYKP